MHDIVWSYVFVCGFVSLAAAETFFPIYALSRPTPRRWTNNAILYLISAAGARLIFQVSGFGLALAMQATSRGVLNQLPLPDFVRFGLGFALLDLRGYLVHRLFHASGLMWRVHQVHHAESDLDVSSGLRFHPGETLFNHGVRLLTIVLLGPPAAAVALGELVVVVQNFLQHANVRIPAAVDRVLRVLIITPGLHRVHHSVAIPEQNANFGTVFSLWDRLFGTFHAGLAGDPAQARYGLAELPHGSDLNAAQVLILPFRRTSRTSASEAECPQE